MKNPFSSFSSLFSKAPTDDGVYQNALREIAYSLGEYFADEFDSARELLEYVEEEDMLPKETIRLLRRDREFCKRFEDGLKAGESEEYDYDEEYGYEDDYDPDYEDEEYDEDYDLDEDEDNEEYFNPLNL